MDKNIFLNIHWAKVLTVYKDVWRLFLIGAYCKIYDLISSSYS